MPFYLELVDIAYSRRCRLTCAQLGPCAVFQLDDYSLVRFIPLDSTSEESISDLLLQIDFAIQYGEDQEVRNADVVRKETHHNTVLFLVNLSE